MINKDKTKIEKCCDSEYTDKILELVDGTLEISELENVHLHIEQCKECSGFYSSQLKTKEYISPLKENKLDYINSITRDQEVFQVSKIMQKINETNKQKNQTSFKNLFFNRVNVLSKVLAVLIFVVVISFISLNYSGLFNMSSNLDQKEIMTSESSLSDSLENDYRAEDDKSPEAYKPIESDNYLDIGQHVNDSLYSKIDEYYFGAIDFIELENELYEYIAILKYYRNEIDTQIRKIESILESENISAELITITGENSQKLLEYVSEEQIENFDSYSNISQTDYVVILIGR